MIKILTAFGNQNINDKLREIEEFEVLENDIFYREGILEFLEENKDIDVIVLCENLCGDIEIEELIKKIKIINCDIDIFFILERKNLELENLLKKQNIKNIFYNEEIDFDDFVDKIKNFKNKDDEKLKQEILKLKNIINEKEQEIKKYKQNYEKQEIKVESNKKVITVIGDTNSGKTLFIENMNFILDKKKNFEFKEINSHNFTEIGKINFLSYKIIYIVEINLEKIKISKKILNLLISENKLDKEKVYIVFNKIDKYSINMEIAKKVFKEFKIVGIIKNSCYHNYILNEKNNYKKENKKLRKKYLRIMKKIKKEKIWS